MSLLVNSREGRKKASGGGAASAGGATAKGRVLPSGTAQPGWWGGVEHGLYGGRCKTGVVLARDVSNTSDQVSALTRPGDQVNGGQTWPSAADRLGNVGIDSTCNHGMIYNHSQGEELVLSPPP